MPENVRSSVVSRGYKIGTLGRNGWNYALFILIFTQFHSFFQGATFINCFRIFKWIARESFLHRVHGVHKQAGISVQINNLEIQTAEITLIQCYFNVTTRKQRWTNVIATPVIATPVWERTKKYSQLGGRLQFK